MCHSRSAVRVVCAPSMTETFAHSEVESAAARSVSCRRSVVDLLVNMILVSDALAIALRHWWTSDAVSRARRDRRKVMIVGSAYAFRIGRGEDRRSMDIVIDAWEGNERIGRHRAESTAESQACLPRPTAIYGARSTPVVMQRDELADLLQVSGVLIGVVGGEWWAEGALDDGEVDALEDVVVCSRNGGKAEWIRIVALEGV